MFEFLGNLFSNALAVTVLVILVTSLIGFCVKMRGRDRCLRDLDGFQVTIETKDDQVAWGTLRTYATPASRKSSPGRPLAGVGRPALAALAQAAGAGAAG